MLTVMTGGSSGFGSLAAQRLRDAGADVVLGARSQSGSRTVGLDLASLESVRAFPAALSGVTSGRSVDALLLNGGMVRGDDRSRTIDGVESTFAVNYLSHYLLLRLLLGSLADGARVVLTTSGTHDPATGAGLTTPRHASAGLLAHPDLDPDREVTDRRAGQHAYTASKLCLVLLARFGQGLGEVMDRGISVVAYDPGQVFGTGLARDLRAPMRWAWRALGTPLGAPLRRLQAHQNTPAAAGRGLASLARADETPSDGRTYCALRRGSLAWTEPSELARRADVGARLWADSADLAGLPV